MVLDASKPKLCPRSEKKVTFWKASIFKMTTSWHWTKLSVSHQFSPEQRFTRSSTFLRASKLYNQVKSPLKLYPFSFAAHIAAYGSNWGITCIEHSHWSPQSPGPALRVSGRPSWHQPLLHTDIDKHAFTAARCTRPCASGAPPVYRLCGWEQTSSSSMCQIGDITGLMAGLITGTSQILSLWPTFQKELDYRLILHKLLCCARCCHTSFFFCWHGQTGWIVWRRFCWTVNEDGLTMYTVFAT